MSKKIMILEDDEATAELMKFYLEEEGFQVVVSSKGTSFLTKAAEYQPDLITLDVLLPDANGFSILKKLQQDERTKRYSGHICYCDGRKKKKESRWGQVATLSSHLMKEN